MVANSDRGHGAGVLDAGVSASMITKHEVLADQRHERIHACVNRDLGEGGSRTLRQERTPGERGRARVRASGNESRVRSRRQTASIHLKIARAREQ